MNILRRLFGGGAPPPDPAIYLYVRCDSCQALVHVPVDPRHDLIPLYGDKDRSRFDEDMDDVAFEVGGADRITGYRLVKEIMDARCFRIMRAEIAYNHRRRELSRQIEGGTFISKEEYDRLVAQDAGGAKE